MRFCEIVGAEPYVTVNSGQGSETMAAAEVEYANGPEDSPMGKWRAHNGRRAPWAVKLWSIGNEMYGSWQLGNMPLADYTRKHNRFAQAMRAKDPPSSWSASARSADGVKACSASAPSPWTI